MPLATLWPIASGRIIGLLLLVLIFVLTLYFMTGSRTPYIRRVLALDVIEEAVGRATEMGKPVLCSFGWGFGGFDYWTMAGLSILSYVARLCAKNDTRLLVPTGGSTDSYIVRPMAVDIIKTAYEAEGKGEQFDEKDVPFMSGDQFAMGTGYAGMLIANRPAAHIMTGSGGADVLMVGEVSNQVGALTIMTGTYMGNVAALACACDYIMIADEAIAAGAYLSREPAQLASIRVQDIYRFLTIGLVAVGIVLIQAGSRFMIDLLGT